MRMAGRAERASVAASLIGKDSKCGLLTVESDFEDRDTVAMLLKDRRQPLSPRFGVLHRRWCGAGRATPARPHGDRLRASRRTQSRIRSGGRLDAHSDRDRYIDRHLAQPCRIDLRAVFECNARHRRRRPVPACCDPKRNPTSGKPDRVHCWRRVLGCERTDRAEAGAPENRAKPIPEAVETEVVREMQ